MTERPEPLCVPELWSLSELSWLQLESHTGIPEVELQKLCAALGFLRSSGTHHWVTGPCAGGCGDVFHADELDEDFRCARCALPRGTGYAWGEEPPPHHRHWLELEKIASAYRRDRREGRLRRIHHEERRQSA